MDGLPKQYNFQLKVWFFIFKQIGLRIQTVWHSDRGSWKNFLKKLFWKKVSRQQQKHEKCNFYLIGNKISFNKRTYHIFILLL